MSCLRVETKINVGITGHARAMIGTVEINKLLSIKERKVGSVSLEILNFRAVDVSTWIYDFTAEIRLTRGNWFNGSGKIVEEAMDAVIAEFGGELAKLVGNGYTIHLGANLLDPGSVLDDKQADKKSIRILLAGRIEGQA